MVVSENSRNPKKKAKRLNSLRGTQRFTRPSQPLGTANVIINTNDAIPKLQQLSQKYIGVNNPHGFLTDLRNALGIPDSSGASKYGEIRIPQSDGSLMKVSLRITNHNSNAETYITHNANYPFNLSILVRKNFQKNRFKPHNNVVLHEYVYYGKKMENIENPLSQIVNSIIGYLQTGKYKDTTGVAMVNTLPKQTSVQTPAPITGTTQNMQNNKTNKNESKNMNKKNTIRLTESDLKRVISESVKRVLEENKYLNKVKIIIRDKNEEPVFCKEIPYDDYEQYYSDWKRCCVNGAFITVEDNYDQGYLQSSKNDDKGGEFFGDPDHPSHYGKTPSKIYGI